MIPGRIENIDIDSKDLISVLYGFLNDDFLGNDLIFYDIEEILYLYLKNSGFDAVVFHNTLDNFYSFSEYDLKILLTQEKESSLKPIENKRLAKGPLYSISIKKLEGKRKKALEQENDIPIFKFIKYSKNYYKNNSTLYKIINQILEKKENKIAIIFNQAPSTTVLTDNHVTVLLLDYLSNQNRMKQKHKLIFNFGPQETLGNAALPTQIMDHIFITENLKSEGTYTKLKPNNEIRISLPLKDEKENLLHYFRLKYKKKFEWSQKDRIINSLNKESLSINQLKLALTNFDIIYDELVQANIIKSDEIKINFSEKDLSKVKGQKDSLDAIHKRLKIWAGRKRKDKPLSFFAVGTSGVGKTMSAKLIGEKLASSGYDYVALSMNEYLQQADSWRLLGSPPGYAGYSDPPLLFEKIRQNRRLVICFDEIEKAHPEILKALMRMVDEGKLSQNNYEGDFSECVLFFTSNLAKDKVVEFKNSYLEQGDLTEDFLLKADFQNKIRELLLNNSKEIPSEVFGRFDAFLVYNPLSPRSIIEISIDFIRDYALNNFGIKIQSISPEFLVKLAEGHAYSQFGARNLLGELEMEVNLLLSDTNYEEL